MFATFIATMIVSDFFNLLAFVRFTPSICVPSTNLSEQVKDLSGPDAVRKYIPGFLDTVDYNTFSHFIVGAVSAFDCYESLDSPNNHVFGAQ